jgi:predicted DNA-binding transcriptional regulator AlpA
MTRAADRPPSYLSKAGLAHELSISETTVDEMVRRGVIPRPARLSSGCVRWRWETVDMALASMGAETDDTPTDIKEGVRRAIEAAKERGRGRAA